MTTPACPRDSWNPRLILLAAGTHVISACWHVLYGGQNTDEGFYALAARSVWQGELPYRDFGYTQTPLLPYVNGLLMQLTGFGLFEQRAVNALWGALTLLLATVWLARRTSPPWALGFALLISLNTEWMYFIHLGKTYAFTGLTVVGALWVFTEWSPGWRKASGLALLGTLGAGSRLPSAPFFAILWLAAITEPHPQGRSWLKALAGSGVWPAALLLPFFLADFEATQFWIFDLHRHATAAKDWDYSWLGTLTFAPGLWLGLVFAVVATHKFRRREFAILSATLLALAVNLLPRGTYQEYGVPFLPALALIGAVGLWPANARFGKNVQWAIPVGLLLLNAGINLALLWPAIPPVRRNTLSVFLPLDAPDYNPKLPANLARARQAVRAYLPPELPFLGPHLILAVEADRNVPRELRMGAFTATADFLPERARRLNLATFPALDAYFNNPRLPLIALTKNASLNYAWSMPSFRQPPERHARRWLEIFQRDFAVVYEDEEFLILARRNHPANGP